MISPIESHRKKKILALNFFFLRTQKKRVVSTKILLHPPKNPQIFGKKCIHVYLIQIYDKKLFYGKLKNLIEN